MRHRPGAAGADPALRRHAHYGPFHCQDNRRSPRQADGEADEGDLMTYLAKPKFHHPDLPKNSLGYTHRDYEGTVSTLCAGCGHDSITGAIIQACFELSIEPHRVAKISGIGCSSKTPTYFLGNSHGFNSVHGRMPSVLTGANLANRDLIYLGVSRDGDSASIGLGQFAHCLRRGVHMVSPRVRSQPPPTAVRSQNVALSTPTFQSIWWRWRCSSARALLPAPSPATSTSWCRSSRQQSRTKAPPSST